jgi:hypothetical protein
MLIEFAPLIFGTAGLLAIFLFFSVEETSKQKDRPKAALLWRSRAADLLL